ncbi:hypothetical protein HK099_002107 [Clydaea vesicula]|uniref:U2 snRNP-associated SURP motif-containing protein n=1 Tax=Clydaea vesicula TaxID=447962 RepID=A0AAD5U4J4_9FUNG|nr:hypothetical protein HK099_002107 [Clydaea vesicula]
MNLKQKEEARKKEEHLRLSQVLLDYESAFANEDKLGNAEKKETKKRNYETFNDIKRSDKVGETLRKMTSLNEDVSVDHDKPSTNLFLSQLNLKCKEEDLIGAFGGFGAIASVKIMHPRHPVDPSRPPRKLTGFVCFMEREDAKNALDSLNGKDLLGTSLRISWGKATKNLPSVPIYDLGNGVYQSSKKMDFSSSHKDLFNMDQRSKNVLSVEEQVGIKVTKPTSEDLYFLIHRTVERVLKHGPSFEAALMKREGKTNPNFEFLYNFDSPEHLYYRWKLYSMLQGDKHDEWSMKKCQIFVDGPIYIPPNSESDMEEETDDSISGDDSDESETKTDQKKKVKPKGVLSTQQRKYFEKRLRCITTERDKIARLMVFCIDHSEASEVIVDLIVESLLIENTPVFPVKMARLYLVSDVLSNSSVSVNSAWKYRTNFEKKLPAVFEHLGLIYTRIESRIAAEKMRSAVLGILNIWAKWILFTGDSIGNLIEKFSKTEEELNQKKEEELKLNKEEQSTTELNVKAEVTTLDSSKWKSVEEIKQPPVTSNSSKWKVVESVPKNKLEIEKKVLDSNWKKVEEIKKDPKNIENSQEDKEEDLDGEPLVEDVDGIKMDEEEENIDGEPLDDIDGAPMSSDDEIDGVPM